jgi:hypothetical protein
MNITGASTKAEAFGVGNWMSIRLVHEHNHGARALQEVRLCDA